jgi:hypothetical protein
MLDRFANPRHFGSLTAIEEAEKLFLLSSLPGAEFL